MADMGLPLYSRRRLHTLYTLRFICKANAVNISCQRKTRSEPCRQIIYLQRRGRPAIERLDTRAHTIPPHRTYAETPKVVAQ